MEYFYCYMWKKYYILMVNDKDLEDGKWNFDKLNWNKWNGEFNIFEVLIFKKDVLKLVVLIKNEGIKYIGEIDEKNFFWFINRKELLELF